MGLGPPVCTECVRTLDFMSDDELKTAEARLNRTISHWWCSKCHTYEFFNEITGFYDEVPRFSNLWLIPKDEQEKYWNK